MFAVIPVVIVVVGKALVVLGAVGVVSFVAWRAYKWIISDPNRDLVVFVGPKTSGKSELLAALRGQMFNPGRDGTGCKMLFNPTDDNVVLDSGGEGNHIENVIVAVLDYIGKKRPDFVLLVLVIDASKRGNAISIADQLGAYLSQFVMVCEEKVQAHGFWNKIANWDVDGQMKMKYKNGKWAYTIVATHRKTSVVAKDVLQDVAGHLRKEQGRIRSVGGIHLFELEEENERKWTVKWLADCLKSAHD